MAAIIQINGGTGGVSDDNVTIGSSVSLYSVDAATTYQWAIVSQPEGPTDALVTPTQRGASFTASKEGSYLLLLTVDDGLPTESSQQLIAAVRELETGDRVPAIGETTENSANDGWANPVDAILRRVTQFTEAGVLPGVAGASGLSVGSIVYASGVYELASGLPGARVVASWDQALANDAATVQGVYGVIVSSVLGGTIATNDVISVQVTGLYQGVPGSPSVGDPVFISDLGDFALTAGTLTRQIGTVCAVGGGTYDIMVGPAPAEIDAPAGGDLSGAFPDPTVVGLQGRPIAATAPSSGEVLGWSGSAWAPTSNSAPPTGSAGGVLGYTGSTYPNPSGLAPVTGSTIPVKGTAAATTTFQVDGSTGGTQAPSLSLRAGANGGGGAGGDATLKAGNSTTGAGGTVFISAGDGDNAGGVAQMLGGDSSAGEGGTIAAGAADSAAGGGATIFGGTGPIGGAITITAGQGDTTLGGDVTLTAGVSSAGNGGSVGVTAGLSADASGGSAVITGGAGATGGGYVAMVGGAGVTLGGAASVKGGAATTGNGGAVGLVGGDSTAGGIGGIVLVDAGTGATNGTVSIGTLNADRVSIGRGSHDVRTIGRNVGVPVTYAPLAATTIPVTGPTIFLNPAANRDMTASPTLQTSGITAGTIVTLVNNDTTFYVDMTQDNGNPLTGSFLKLATGNIYLFKYDSITFIFDGIYWVEVSRNVQPGKAYTPVAGTTIPYLCPTILLDNAGAVDLGAANALVQVIGINAGSRVSFLQRGVGSTKFARGGSTLFKLANPTITLDQYDTLELVFEGTFWCEVTSSNNA